jgi:hypothetical protein
MALYYFFLILGRKIAFVEDDDMLFINIFKVFKQGFNTGHEKLFP